MNVIARFVCKRMVFAGNVCVLCVPSLTMRQIHVVGLGVMFAFIGAILTVDYENLILEMGIVLLGQKGWLRCSFTVLLVITLLRCLALSRRCFKVLRKNGQSKLFARSLNMWRESFPPARIWEGDSCMRLQIKCCRGWQLSLTFLMFWGTSCLSFLVSNKCLWWFHTFTSFFCNAFSLILQ